MKFLDYLSDYGADVAAGRISSNLAIRSALESTINDFRGKQARIALRYLIERSGDLELLQKAIETAETYKI